MNETGQVLLAIGLIMQIIGLTGRIILTIQGKWEN